MSRATAIRGRIERRRLRTVSRSRIARRAGARAARLAGRHNVLNALAAAAAAHAAASRWRRSSPGSHACSPSPAACS